MPQLAGPVCADLLNIILAKFHVCMLKQLTTELKLQLDRGHATTCPLPGPPNLVRCGPIAPSSALFTLGERVPDDPRRRRLAPPAPPSRLPIRPPNNTAHTMLPLLLPAFLPLQIQNPAPSPPLSLLRPRTPPSPPPFTPPARSRLLLALLRLLLRVHGLRLCGAVGGGPGGELVLGLQGWRGGGWREGGLEGLGRGRGKRTPVCLMSCARV